MEIKINCTVEELLKINSANKMEIKNSANIYEDVVKQQNTAREQLKRITYEEKKEENQ